MACAHSLILSEDFPDEEAICAVGSNRIKHVFYSLILVLKQSVFSHLVSEMKIMILMRVGDKSDPRVGISVNAG